MPSARDASRIEIADQLRGLAALAVAWFHFTHGGTLATGWLKDSGAHGWLGVEVFFVISGFVIPYSMARAGYRLSDWSAFLGKRLLRLHPPYLAAVALALVLLYASAATPWFRGPDPAVDSRQVLLHLGYLNDIAGVPWLNPVFWSLAIELQFYLVVALAFPLLAHGEPAMRWACLAVFCALGLAVPGKEFVFMFAPVFALGMLAWWQSSGRMSGAAFLLGVLALAALIAATRAVEVAVPTAIAALLIGSVTARPIGWLAFAGAISYSFYLVHLPVGGRVVNLGLRFADGAPAQALVLLLALAASIAAAVVMHRLVELPARAWSSRIGYRRGAAPAAYTMADAGKGG